MDMGAQGGSRIEGAKGCTSSSSIGRRGREGHRPNCYWSSAGPTDDGQASETSCPGYRNSIGCDYFSTTPKWLGISGIAGSVGSVGPSKCRAIKIAPGFRSIGACQLLLGQVRKRRSRQSFHPPEKQPQLTILTDGVSIERRHFRVEF